MQTLATPDFDPSRPVITLGDARLTRCMLGYPAECATVSEYARWTGMDTTEVLDRLGPWLDNGTLALETFGNELFVHTAPQGRPGPPHLAQVPANLWELLRSRSPEATAHGLWRLLRQLQRAGWLVETSPSRIMFGLASVADRPHMGLKIAANVVPLLILPSPDALAAPAGLLSEYERAGASMVGIVCENSALDETVTAVRRWVNSRNVTPGCNMLILEAPQYEPVFLSATDAAIAPRYVTRVALESQVGGRKSLSQ